MKHFAKTLFVFFSLQFFCAQIAKAQTADFTLDKTLGCNPLVVSFSDKSSGTITSYFWDFGNTITSTLKNPSTTYIAAGTYTIKLTVRNGSGTPSTKSATVIVYPSPTATYTTSAARICPCENVIFTNTSTANSPGAFSTIWSFGDGYTATTNNTNHAYCTPGSYNVALKVTNSAGCASTRVDTTKVIVYEKPFISFNASKTKLCKVPDTTIFSSTVTKGKAPYTYAWNFGDGIGTSTLSTPTYSYTGVGIYTVRLIVTDVNGCKDTLSRVNFIRVDTMNATFSKPASICAGVSLVRFDNTSTPTPLGTKWIWSDGVSATGSSPQRDFWKGGTYGVTMIDSFGPGCKDTAIANYTVYPKPRPNFAYSPIYPCPAPATITFVNHSNGADSFTWIFGDGTTSKLKNPVHTYTKDSVFTVFLIARTSFGCLDTFRVRDTTKDFPLGYPKVRGVFSKPTYDSSNSPVIIRVRKGFLTTLIDSGGGCLPFVLTPIALLCGSNRFPGNSYDDVTLKDRSCAAPAPYGGYSYPPYWPCAYDGHLTDKYPDDVVDPYIIENKTTCDHPGVKFAYPIVSYLWDFGDGSPTTTVDSPTHTYYTEGYYTVKVTVVTHNGCSYTDSFSVTAGETPLADFTATPQQICIHDSVTFTNKSHRGIGYTWFFGDGEMFTSVDSAVVFKHRFDKADTFLTILKANRLGCIDTMGLQIIVHPPEVEQRIIYSCDTPLKVRFVDSSLGATSILWKFGDGSSSTLSNPTHTYTAEGKYWVTQIVYNNVYNCVDSDVIEMDIFIPKPFFYTPDTTICLGDTIMYIDSPRSYFINHFWYSDTFKQEGYKNNFIVNKYKDTGRYSVLYVAVDKHNCLDTFRRNNYVLVAKPQMKIKASPLIACAPAAINFIDSSTNTKGAINVSRKWNWGDTKSSTDTAAITAIHSYPTPGIYTIKLVTTDNVGCKDSAFLTIESRKPKANFGAELDTYTCIGKPNNFVSTSTGVSLSYAWDFGDGGKGTGATITYTYYTIGTFTVRLIVTDGTGCKDTITKIAFIKTTKPKASFSMSDSMALCPPLFVKFTNTSADSLRSYWNFNNGSTSAVPSPVSPYIDSGKYTISLVVTNLYGCKDTAYGTARVLGYDGVLKYTPLSGCAPHTVNFIAEPILADVMVWDFADGVTESAVGKLTTKHTYSKPGAYLPRLILGDGKGCSTSSKGLDTIKVDGTVATISHTPACINTDIIFNDSSYSYFSTHASSEWIFDDTVKISGKNPIRKYSKLGTYRVSLITTNTNGCKDTVYSIIVISGLPNIKANDTVICLNDQAVLQASGGVSYTWLPSPSLSCTDCNNPTTNTKVPIRYYVIGTDANGCQNRDTLDVGIKTKTTLIIKDTQVCEKKPLQLIASGAQNYYWSPETFLSNANIANPIATLDTSIVYRIIGTEGSCIPDTGFMKITVYPLPKVDAGANQKVLAGTEVQLNGSGKNIKDYLWAPATALSCTDCPNPTAKPTATITYTLVGTSQYGCSDSDGVTITIFCDQSQLFIPNTFTPNNDGQNDYFYPQGKGIGKIKSFVIFNRWGQKVFERTNMDANTREQGWDGTLNGTPLNPDTFVYTLEAACDNGEIVFWKGDVTLIK